MKKIKQYKYIILIVIVLLVVGFIFYWLQIRPSQIIKNCITSYPKAFETYDESRAYGLIKPYEHYLIDLNKVGYQKCLRENGLKI